MKSKMLINAVHPEECRVAIVEEGVLQELEVEYSGREQTRGNIYKGVIARVEPSVHALFVDFGGNRQGFLSFSEVRPSLYGRDIYIEGETEGEKPTIEKVMKPGHEIMIQVVKEERDTKGAYLTTYISIAGRYLVLMPGSRKGGVSRRIENEKEREKLREIISQLNVPADAGVIIRTAGMGRTKGELKKDLNSLDRVWKNIRSREKIQKAPSILYREGDVVIRSIRDYFSSDVEEILVDNPEAHRRAREFVKIVMPRFQSRVKLYQDSIPLFSRYNLERQMESIYGSRVRLKSGGSIVIDPTEALVSIDVNSGRARGEKNIEGTAFKTNLEAAAEIARQLRLRDLGGLIVIDFIDMRQKKHILEVERTLKNALKRDKAQIDLGRISKFGLLEMSRQRIRSSLIERTFVPCPHCGGSGTIKSTQSNIVYILRKMQEAVTGKNVGKVDVLLSQEIANYLLNQKREDILKIERAHDVEIFITGQPGIPVDSFNIEVTKREGDVRHEKPPADEAAKDKAVKPQRRPSGRRGGRGRERREKRPEDASKAAEKDVLTEPEKEEGAREGLLGRIRSVLKKE